MGPELGYGAHMSGRGVATSVRKGIDLIGIGELGFRIARLA
jgi:hypothetical protein